MKLQFLSMLMCIFLGFFSCKAQQPKYYVGDKRPNTMSFKSDLGDSCIIGVMFNRGDSVLVFTTDLIAYGADTLGLSKLSFVGGFTKRAHFLTRDQNKHTPWITPLQFEKFKKYLTEALAKKRLKGSYAFKYAEQKFFTKY